MAEYNVEDISDVLVEAKWNAKEAFRLFREIKIDCGIQLDGVGIPLNSNLPRTNIGWVLNHLERTLNYIEQAELEVLKYKLLREAVEDLATENVAIKKRFLEEKRRTASLYHSINDLVVEKITCENNLEEAKGKMRELRLELNRARREKDEVAAAARKIVEKQERIERKRKNSDNEATKRSKVAHSVTAVVSSDSSALTLAKTVQIPLPPAAAAKSVSSSAQGKSISIPVHDTMSSTALTPHTTSSSAGSGAGTSGNSGSKQQHHAVSEYATCWIGRRILKHFKGHGDFVGIIKAYRHPFFEVRYPADNDFEDMTEGEILKYLLPPDDEVCREEEKPKTVSTLAPASAPASAPTSVTKSASQFNSVVVVAAASVQGDENAEEKEREREKAQEEDKVLEN
jgi:hypothetical protein